MIDFDKRKLEIEIDYLRDKLRSIREDLKKTIDILVELGALGENSKEGYMKLCEAIGRIHDIIEEINRIV